MRGGRVYINGKLQKEPFIRPERLVRHLQPARRRSPIPKGHYFMMGDNRGESADSRDWGPVPKKWMIGQAFVTYWPPGKIGEALAASLPPLGGL